MGSIDKPYPNWLEMPNELWKEVFSYLKPEDMRIARLACCKFDILYEELNPIRTASYREAFVRLDKSFCPTRLKNIREYLKSERDSLCAITDMPTHFLVLDKGKKFKLYSGSDLEHPEKRFPLPERIAKKGKIQILNARLADKDEIEVFFQADKVFYMASWKWGEEPKVGDFISLLDVGNKIVSFHANQDLLCVITKHSGVSFRFDRGGIKGGIRKLFLVRGPFHTNTIYHPSKPHAFLEYDEDDGRFAKIWNYADNTVFHLEKPLTRRQVLQYSAGFYASHLMVCWEYRNKSITCDYDLSCTDQDLKSQRTFIDRGKRYHRMKIVADKYVIRQARTGDIVCDTIADRVRLWKIQDMNFRFLLKMHLPPIHSSFILIRYPLTISACNVVTGEEHILARLGEGCPFAFVYSSEASVLLTH